jgi:hypothetical protein
MSTMSHEPSRTVQERPSWMSRLGTEMLWPCLTIVVMWLAVLFAAVFGPDIVSTSGGAGGASSTVPSAVAVALFAFLGTWVVAKYGFRHERRE